MVFATFLLRISTYFDHDEPELPQDITGFRNLSKIGYLY
jgi:hypothetical protein